MKDESALLRSLGGATPVLEGVAARGRIDGVVFDVMVEQRYANHSPASIEAVYTFPLPWAAVLLSLELEIGDRRLSGVVVEKGAAQERYEGAIDKGDSAVLLEQTADGLYTMNVANLLPGEQAVIRYRYAQLLSFAKGQVRVTIPTVIAPRFGNAQSQGGLQAQQVPTHALLAEYPFTVEVDVRGQLAHGLIQSPSHAIGMRITEGGVRTTLTGRAYLDRDFVLSIGALPVTATATVVPSLDGYALHAAFCPSFPAGGDSAGHALKVLVDCSGSMAGDSITAARVALHEILAHLGPEDRFALSCFGNSIRHVQKSLHSADDAAIRHASEAISKIQADMGGTEMEKALASVLANDAESQADVLLITDGHVWNVEGVIQRALRSGHRVFVVGIGAAAAEALLRRLGEESGGASEFVTANDDIAAAITRMFLRMGQPPATEMQFSVDGGFSWVTPLPKAMYEGETVHVFAGLPAEPSGTSQLTYRLADGTYGSQSIAIEMGAVDSAIDRIAAFRRLPLIEPEMRTSFAVRYGLVTESTSLMLVHEREKSDRATDMPATVVVPQMMPAGFMGMTAGRAALRPGEGLTSDVACEVDMFAELNGPGVARSMNACFAMQEQEPVPSGPQSPSGLFVLLSRRCAVNGSIRKALLPKRMKELAELGVPMPIVERLIELEKMGFSETLIVRLMLEFVAEQVSRDGYVESLIDKILALFRKPGEYDELRMRVHRILSGTSADQWCLDDNEVRG